MMKLPVDVVIALVRRNLDELDPNGSLMYNDENGSSGDYGDNQSLDSTIARFVPEAINTVHLAAPVALLEGDSELTPASVSLSQDGVLSFALPSGSSYLRLVGFRAIDSSIVVTDTIPQASPEGRKQLNPHIRGRADRPRLVILQGKAGPDFKYYSVDTPGQYTHDPESAIAFLSIIHELHYSVGARSYDISPRLKQNVVDQVTARVLETYGDQRYQLYQQRSITFAQ